VLEPQLRSSAEASGSFRETQLQRRIGQGTYGSVYLGSCGGGEVAVKVMALQADTAEDIKREIEIMRHCDCVNIVKYLDAFLREHQMRSSLWVVMEFCQVGSTLDLMRKQQAPLPLECIAWVCAGVLSGLEYLHTQRRTIHRDIKAANVLLTREPVVKLADLGVAAQLYSTMSKRGTMIGTPHWMAPETLAQKDGDEGKYGTKVDIWGLGITAIELVQMAPPLAETKSVFQVMMLIVNGPPPQLPPDAPNASPLFREFLAAALVKEPASRPSATELRRHPFIASASPDALKALVDAQQTRPSPPAATAPPAAAAGRESIEKTMVL